jgi:acetyltransferase-like isoleucine patch superfamily enzyme
MKTTKNPSDNVDRFDVFISYKRENINFVSKISQELSDSAHDVKAWVDLEKLHKKPSKKYREQIHSAIDKSKLFLLIYTKDVEKSDFIIDEELSYAINKKKPIFVFPQDAIQHKSRIFKDVGKLQWLDTKETVKFQSDIQEALHDSKRAEELSRLTGHGFTTYNDLNVFLIRLALQRELGKVTPFGNYTIIASTPSTYRQGLSSLKVAPKSFILDVPNEYKGLLFAEKFLQPNNNEEISRLLVDLNVDNKEIYNRLISFIHSHTAYNKDALFNWLKDHIKQHKEIYESIILPSKEDLSEETFISVVSKMTACSILHDIKVKTLFNGAELGVEYIKDGRTNNTEEHYVEMSLYYSDYFTFKTMTEMYHILSSIDDRPFKPIKEKGADLRPFSPFLCSLGLGGFVVVYQNGLPYLMWTKRSEKISSGDMWHFSFDETVSVLKDSQRIKDKISIDKNNAITINPKAIINRAIKEEIGIPDEYIEECHSGFFEIGLIQSERLEIELISYVTMHMDKELSLKTTFKKWHDSASDGYLEISKIDFIPLKEKSDLVGRLLSPEALSVRDRLSGRVIENIGRNTIIGDRTIIESGSYIDDGAIVGNDCKIHRNVYIGKGVKIGNLCKIQNNNSIYPGVTIKDGVFIGTNVCFTNDRYPRAILRNGQAVSSEDWDMEETLIKYGASIGSGAVIRCGVTIGEWAMIGCGAVVLEDVPDGATAVGNPAHIISSKETIK